MVKVDKDVLEPSTRDALLAERRAYEGRGAYMCWACGYCVVDRHDDEGRLRECPHCVRGTTGRGWVAVAAGSYADEVSGTVREMREAGIRV